MADERKAEAPMPTIDFEEVVDEQMAATDPAVTPDGILSDSATSTMGNNAPPPTTSVPFITAAPGANGTTDVFLVSTSGALFALRSGTGKEVKKDMDSSLGFYQGSILQRSLGQGQGMAEIQLGQSDARVGSAVAYRRADSNTPCRRLYFVNPDGLLSELCQDGEGKGWFVGTLIRRGEDVRVRQGSSITAVMSGSTIGDMQLKVFFYPPKAPGGASGASGLRVAFIDVHQTHGVWEVNQIA